MVCLCMCVSKCICVSLCVRVCVSASYLCHCGSYVLSATVNYAFPSL